VAWADFGRSDELFGLSGATHYCDREVAFRIRNKCQIVLGDGWVPVLVGRAVTYALNISEGFGSHEGPAPDVRPGHARLLTRIIHEKCAVKAKPLISFTTMRMGCLMKFFAMKSLAQVFGGLGRFRAVR